MTARTSPQLEWGTALTGPRASRSRSLSRRAPREDAAVSSRTRSRSVITRSARRTVRHTRTGARPRAVETAAIQVFLFRAERFLGTQLFGANEPVVVGRSRRAHLQLEGDTVSRLHCQLEYESGRILVEDLGSANGTYVNRHRLEARQVAEPSDAIHLGAYTMRVRALDIEGGAFPGEGASAEAVTRIEAILNVEESEDASAEAVIDIFSGIGGPGRARSSAGGPGRGARLDQRLYEEAIRRATGEERARSVRPSREGSRTDTDRPPLAERAQTLLPGDSRARDATSNDREFRERLRDLDDLIASLDAREARDGSDPAAVPEAGFFDEVWTRSGQVASLPLPRPQVRSTASGTLAPALPAPKAPKPREDEPTLSEPGPARRALAPGAGKAGRSNPGDEASLDREVQPTPPGQADDRGRSLAAEDRWRGHDAIEIAARSRGRLLDIAVLTQEGDQYVLGHPTPQGRLAPASAHPGLRLLRINADRTVDLVFPIDVGGDIVRGKEKVALSELTEGRKYSCLRLEGDDVATVLLGDGAEAVTYSVRFTRRGSRPG